MVFRFISSARRSAQLLAASAAMFVAACDVVPQLNTTADGAQKAAQIALLLPMGAEDAGLQALSASAAKAARMALADTTPGIELTLRVYDTLGDEMTAAAVAQQAVAEGADIIVGPLFAGNAVAVGNVVAPAGVNVLTLSNNAEAAGGNVYLLGNTFENTAERIVGFAAAQGKRRALIVHANSPAELQARDAVEFALVRAGMAALVEGYDLTPESVAAATSRAADTIRGQGVDTVILTSDPAGGLSFLAQLLPEAGVNPALVQYVGTSRWDAAPQGFSLPGIQGGWFTLPNQARTAAFRERYMGLYGSPPHELASLAFDGVAAVAASLSAGGPAPLGAAGLTRSRGFQGATGPFRWDAAGRVTRNLSIATIRGNQIFVIDQAPAGFAPSGS